MVVAETPAAARDGAERVDVEWTPLPAVTASTGRRRARRADPLRRDRLERVRGRRGRRRRRPSTAHSRAAAHVVRLDTWVQRVTGVPMEPRAAVGAWDAGERPLHRARRRRRPRPDADRRGRRARRARERGARGGARRRRELRDAQQLLSRVRAGRVGGAPRSGRPVKWTGERREAFLADYRGRDLAARAELALDAEGNFLAFRGANTSNVGAHAVSFHPLNKGMALDGARSTACLPCRCTGAPSSPTRRRPRRTGAPAARRSCSSWSG